MSIRQDNTAYDFSRFAASVPQALPRVKQPPQLRVVETARPKNTGFAMRSMLCFLTILGIVAGILYNNVLLTEMTSEIQTLEQQFKQLQSENQRMSVEIESRIPLREVQEKAQNSLGMSKIEPYQVRYIDLGEKEGVRMVQIPDPTTPEVVLGMIKPLLSGIGG